MQKHLFKCLRMMPKKAFLVSFFKITVTFSSYTNHWGGGGEEASIQPPKPNLGYCKNTHLIYFMSFSLMCPAIDSTPATVLKSQTRNTNSVPISSLLPTQAFLCDFGLANDALKLP